MSAALTFYRELLGGIKDRIRTAQHKAALSANTEMIALYWDIGSMIAARQKEEGRAEGHSHILTQKMVGLTSQY